MKREVERERSRATRTRKKSGGEASFVSDKTSEQVGFALVKLLMERERSRAVIVIKNRICKAWKGGNGERKALEKKRQDRI